MTTKTAAPMTPDEAEAARDALLDRIAEGVVVDPLDIVRADAAIGMASITEAAQVRRAAQEAEELRLARIDALRQRVLAIDETHIEALFAEATKAMRALVAEAERLEDESEAIERGMQALTPYPDDVDTGRVISGKPANHGHIRRFAGVRLHTRTPGSYKFGESVALAAVAQVKPSAVPSVGPALLRQFGRMFSTEQKVSA
jgi:hypothetical protein